MNRNDFTHPTIAEIEAVVRTAKDSEQRPPARNTSAKRPTKPNYKKHTARAAGRRARDARRRNRSEL